MAAEGGEEEGWAAERAVRMAEEVTGVAESEEETAAAAMVATSRDRSTGAAQSSLRQCHSRMCTARCS